MASKAHILILVTTIGNVSTSINLNNLNATGTPLYTGSGAPWTVGTTTPFEIAMNDRTGQRWTPQAAPQDTVYGGGPPFVHGSQLIYSAYENVQETIPIQVRASTSDYLVFLKRLLQQALKSGRFGEPPVLIYSPYTSAGQINYTIVDGEVQESPDAANEENNRGIMRLTVKITRLPFGGLYSSQVENGLSSSTVTLKNGANQSPANNVGYATNLTGELANEGQPLNVRVQPQTGLGSGFYRRLYLASVYDVVYRNTGAGTYTVTPGTQTQWSAGTYDVSTLINMPLKGRIMVNATGNTNTEVQITARVGESIFDSEWLPIDGAGVVDSGPFLLDALRVGAYTGAVNLEILLTIRTTNTSNGSMTYANIEWLWYYTFALLDMPGNTNAVMVVNSFTDQQNQVALPRIPLAGVGNGTVTNMTSLLTRAQIRGTPPRYYPGTKLWLLALESALYNGTYYTYTPTRAFTVRVQHSPLWRTQRGLP